MIANKRPLKVFLCHAHADRNPVRALYSRLTKGGVDVWLDKEKLLPGQDWELEIRKAVREADVVVVCLSKQFNQAGFRQKEVRWALDTAMKQPEDEIFIIPARLEECSVPDNLSRWHWVNLFEYDGFEWLERALGKRSASIGASYKPTKNKEIKTSSISKDLSVNEITICLSGPPGSGKSTFLAMLPYSETSGWKILPHDLGTRNIVFDYSQRLRDMLIFIPPTIPIISHLAFDFFPPKGIEINRNFRVTMAETAGEFYERPQSNLAFFGEMSRSKAIVWLIDPTRIDEPSLNRNIYKAMISEWLYGLFEIQGRKELEQPMAFCLTKMDLPEHYRHFDDPRNYCLEIMGVEIEAMLSNFCNINKVNYFSTSSIGFTPGTKKSNIDQTNFSRLIHPAEPVNLFQPFLWLFDVMSKS